MRFILVRGLWMLFLALVVMGWVFRWVDEVVVEEKEVSKLCGSGGKPSIGEEGRLTNWAFWDGC